jgi:hypothetical protein
VALLEGFIDHLRSCRGKLWSGWCGLTVVEEAITILVVFGWVADMERNTIEEKQSDFFFSVFKSAA